MMARFARGPVRAKDGRNAYDGLRDGHAGTPTRGRVLDDRRPYARGPSNRKALRRVELAGGGVGEPALPAGQWTDAYVPALPSGRDNAIFAWTSAGLHVVAGRDAAGSLSDHWIWSGPGADWQGAAPLPAAGYAHGYTYEPGAIYAVGGSAGSNLYVYDVASDSWSTIASVSGVDNPALVKVGRYLYICGGATFGSVAAVTRWDLFAGSSSSLASLPSPQAGGHGHHYDGKLYCTFGTSNGPDLFVYDVAAGSWSTATDSDGSHTGAWVAAGIDGRMWLGDSGDWKEWDLDALTAAPRESAPAGASGGSRIAIDRAGGLIHTHQGGGGYPTEVYTYAI